ncbi:hypothetical protein AJ79_00447 [Helicocarpus griseus UAMH5409]|uniref:Uncharacterized protein n=1 Tax=Helicocarpus griseus UAMH5409 TaxID=1447875 RepID=A0A2B7YB23_9EURO|nr:hypothetical protein AJ79_00447 [Helicocarpus griseus UAMH5409]
MSGLVGKDVAHVDLAQKSILPTTRTIVQSLVGENGQNCRLLKEYSCKAARDLRCHNGERLVGWDRDGCDEGRPICCPGSTAPRKCMCEYFLIQYILNNPHTADSLNYHQGAEVAVTVTVSAIPGKPLFAYPPGEVEELALRAKVARTGAVEEPKLSAAKPGTGRTSSMVVAGPAGR